MAEGGYKVTLKEKVTPLYNHTGTCRNLGYTFRTLQSGFSGRFGTLSTCSGFLGMFNRLHTQIPEKVYFQDYLSDYHLLTFHIGQFCVDERWVCTDFWPNN